MTSATSLAEGQMSRRHTGPSIPIPPGAVSRFLGRRQVVAQEYGSIDPDPERLVVEVDVDAAREGIRHDQRRGGEVVRAHFLLNPALEVAISREHRAYDEI